MVLKLIDYVEGSMSTLFFDKVNQTNTILHHNQFQGL